jgi:hypothetical protein
MKKVITFFCFGLMCMAAQSAHAQAEIDKGNVLLNAGFGFGYYYAGGVPFVASAEWALNDAISIGPYFAYTSYSYKWGYSIYSGRYRYTFVDVGVRGSYHFNKHLNLSTDKLDLYGGANLGYRVSSFSGDGDFDDPYPSTLAGGIFGGARWYFSDRFAVNGELGFGLAPLYLGVTFKL